MNQQLQERERQIHVLHLHRRNIELEEQQRTNIILAPVAPQPQAETEYTARLFYINYTTTSYEIHMVVTRNIEEHFTVSVIVNISICVTNSMTQMYRQ